MGDRCSVDETIPEVLTKVSVATITQSESEAVPPGRALAYSLSRNEPPPGPRPCTFNEVAAHNPPRIALPPFSVLSTLVFPRIPREPRVTLSFLGAERFQLSDATQGELDMKLYAFRVDRLLVKLTISCQSACGCMQTSQTGNPLHLRKTTSSVTRRYFGDRCQPVLHTRCSVYGDVLLR